MDVTLSHGDGGGKRGTPGAAAREPKRELTEKKKQVDKMVDYIGKGSPGPGMEKFRVWGRVYQPRRRVTGREVGAEG